GIHRLVMALEERGFIRRLPNRARALEVLKLPESSTPQSPRGGKFSPSVIEGHLGRVRQMPSGGDDGAMASVAVPVMGRIAAGTPRSRSKRQTPLMRRGFSVPTACASRASWSV